MFASPDANIFLYKQRLDIPLRVVQSCYASSQHKTIVSPLRAQSLMPSRHRRCALRLQRPGCTRSFNSTFARESEIVPLHQPSSQQPATRRGNFTAYLPPYLLSGCLPGWLIRSRVATLNTSPVQNRCAPLAAASALPLDRAIPTATVTTRR